MSQQWIRLFFGQNLTARHFAWLTVAASLGLSLVGIYAIDVASNTEPAATVITLGGRPLKQALYVAVGIIAAACVAAPDYRIIRLFAWPAMWAVLGLLVFLLIPWVPRWLVRPYNGARGWINLGFMDFQPAEVAKIAYVLVMADYLRYRKNHRTFMGLIPPAIITFIPVALITLQPDLGTASLFIPSLGAMLVAAGARLKHLVIIVTLAAMAGPTAYHSGLLQEHQKKRIDGLIKLIEGSPEGRDGINYQSLTAMTLAGAGGVGGMTDEKSRSVVYYNRLPERHNDMIFAVVMNRFGLLGGLGVVALYMLWFLGAFLTAAICREPFGRLVVVGLAAIIAAQMFINISMTLGLLPIIGLTLPYVSLGGSSMLTVWLMTGLIVNVAMRSNQHRLTPAFEFKDDDDEA